MAAGREEPSKTYDLKDWHSAQSPEVCYFDDTTLLQFKLCDNDVVSSKPPTQSAFPVGPQESKSTERHLVTCKRVNTCFTMNYTTPPLRRHKICTQLSCFMCVLFISLQNMSSVPELVRIHFAELCGSGISLLALGTGHEPGGRVTFTICDLHAWQELHGIPTNGKASMKKKTLTQREGERDLRKNKSLRGKHIDWC